MRLLDIIKRGNKNLLRSKTRTILTIMAVFIGALTLNLTIALGTGAQSFINNQTSTYKVVNALEIQKQSSNNGSDLTSPRKYNPNEISGGQGVDLVTQKDIAKISKTSDISYVQPSYGLSPDYITRTGQDKYLVQAIGYFNNLKSTIEAGTIPDQNTPDTILIPDPYVKALGFSNPNDAIGQTVSLQFSQPLGQSIIKNFVIKAVFTNNIIVSGFVGIDLPDAISIYNYQYKGTQGYDSFGTVYGIYPSSLTSSQIDKLKSNLNKEGFTARTYQDTINQIQSVISGIQVGLSIFGAIAILVSAFGIINTILMSIYERTREIGLMKALGMSRKNIFGIFALEASSLGFWGGVLGSAVAILAGSIINKILSNGILKGFFNYKLLQFSPGNIALIIIALSIVAFLSGTIPAIKASKLDPIEALRYE